MKLRLFTLRNTHTNKTNGEHFASKPEAKARRDELNQDTQDSAKPWVVSYGPDHRHFKG